jgi:hypothetical protein
VAAGGEGWTCGATGGEPRDPAPYLERYGEWRAAQSPGGFWRHGWDTEDELIAVEESHPSIAGEVEWRQVRRKRGEHG